MILDLVNCHTYQVALYKDEIALKLSKGVTCERIVESICKVNLNASSSNYNLSNSYPDIRECVGDRVNRDTFEQITVSRKHFVSKQDIRTIKKHVKERLIRRHSNDSTSVALVVAELQAEEYDPVLIYK